VIFPVLFNIVAEIVDIKKYKIERKLVPRCPLHFLSKPYLKIPMAEDTGQLIDKTGPLWIQDLELFDMVDHFLGVEGMLSDYALDLPMSDILSSTEMSLSVRMKIGMFFV